MERLLLFCRLLLLLLLWIVSKGSKHGLGRRLEEGPAAAVIFQLLLLLLLIELLDSLTAQLLGYLAARRAGGGCWLLLWFGLLFGRGLTSDVT